MVHFWTISNSQCGRYRAPAAKEFLGIPRNGAKRHGISPPTFGSAMQANPSGQADAELRIKAIDEWAFFGQLP